MYCKHCGRQIADDSKFCEFCGQLVQKTYSDPVIPEQEPAPMEEIGAPILKEEDGFASVPSIMEEEPVAEQVPVDTAPTRVAPVTTAPEEEAPEEEDEEPPKKPISKGLLWGLIGGGIGLVAIIALILALALHKPPVKVDVTQYVDFKVSGYDGYGVATCELDTDALERAALGEYPTGTDGKIREKQIEYKERAAVLKGAVTLHFEKQQGLSVGDELVAELKVDRSVEKELNIEFSTNLTCRYKITEKDLSGSVEIDVLGEFFDIEFEGFDGLAVAKFITKERKEEFYFTVHDGTEYTVEPALETATGKLLLKLHSEDGSTESVTLETTLSASEKLKNGDQVTLSLTQSTADKLMDYGLKVTSRELSVTVEGLDTFVTEPGQLEEGVLEGWISDYTTGLENYVLANWNKLVHGGNTLSSAVTSIENLECIKQVVAYSDNSNALFLIFSADLNDDAIMVDNFGLPRRHYFAVRIENLIIDAEGKLLEDQLKLPGDDGKGYFGAYTQMEDLNDKTVGLYENVSEE